MKEKDSILSFINSLQAESQAPVQPHLSKKDNEMLEQTMQYEKRIYDLEQLLDIAQSFCSTLDFKNLLESIVYICMAQMHVLGAEIFTRDLITSENFELRTTNSPLIIREEGVDEISFPYSSSITSKLIELNNPVTLDELKAEIKKSDNVDDKKTCKRIFEIFEDLNPSLIVPLLQGRRLNGILILQERIAIEDDVSYSSYEKHQMMSIATLASVAINNASLIEKTSTDSMTHLRLKYFFFNKLTESLDYAAANNKRVAVLMFDIDFFKKFNDTYGHECGDCILIQVAKLIKENLRESDIASRYGGEEFTVLLENTGKEDAVRIAERIRKSIANYTFQYGGKDLHVTISGGVSLFWKRNPQRSPAKLVIQADKALYVSKQTGRNKITYFTPEYDKILQGKTL